MIEELAEALHVVVYACSSYDKLRSALNQFGRIYLERLGELPEHRRPAVLALSDRDYAASL
jgi:hypothetical protein